MDWLANLLPSEGRAAGQMRARNLVRPAPTARIDERTADVRARLGRSDEFALVVDDLGVVLGILRREGGDGDLRVGDAMDAAPVTIRPHLTPEAAQEFLEHAPVLVTTSDGILVGILDADAIRRAVPRSAAA
jgi:hypothetical protein